MSDAVLKAIYEQTRTALLVGYLSGGEVVRDRMKNAYVFAWLHRMPPVGLTKEEACFEPVYDVPTKSVQRVFDHINAILDRDALDELSYRNLARALSSEEDPRLGAVVTYFILCGHARSHKALDALQSDVTVGHYVSRRFGPDHVELPS